MFWTLIFAAAGEYLFGKRKPVRTSFYNIGFPLESFYPCSLFPFSIQQMILSRLLRKPTIAFKKHIIPFADGVNCRLDVVTADASKQSKKLIVFSPGFSGSIESPYCHHMAKVALASGYSMVVYNRRAHIYDSVSSTYPLHYDESDLKDVITWIKAEFPDYELYGIGVSSGGNMLMKYAGDAADKCVFKSVVSVCNGLDINHVIEQCETFPLVNKLITNFTRQVLDNVENGGHTFAPSVKEMSQLEHNALFAINGTKQHMPDYYESMSSIKVIRNITVPTLCICSDDDILFRHSHEYYLNMIQANPLISVLITSHGGHTGYVDRSFGCDWWCRNALTYIEGPKIIM